MAQDFARKFYSSHAWRVCRESYAKKAHHLCERCLSRGLIRSGEIVHHVQEITPANVDRPEVTLNFDNLMLLCRDCHAEVHDEIYRARTGRRYKISEDGTVEVIPHSG